MVVLVYDYLVRVNFYLCWYKFFVFCCLGGLQSWNQTHQSHIKKLQNVSFDVEGKLIVKTCNKCSDLDLGANLEEIFFVKIVDNVSDEVGIIMSFPMLRRTLDCYNSKVLGVKGFKHFFHWICFQLIK